MSLKRLFELPMYAIITTEYEPQLPIDTKIEMKLVIYFLIIEFISSILSREVHCIIMNYE